MWPVLVDQIVGFMLIHTWFTAAVLLTNANYVGSGVMAFTITPPLVVRDGEGLFTVPLQDPADGKRRQTPCMQAQAGAPGPPAPALH